MRRKPFISSRSAYSTCGDIIVRGDQKQIAARYEEMAREASVSGDARMYHIYLNHAEHYRKVPQDA